MEILIGGTTYLSAILESWHLIDWKQVNSKVTELRSKIYTCTKEGNLQKVNYAQLELLQNPSTLLKSIRRVSSRPAAKTAGIDGYKVTSSEDKLDLFNELLGVDLVTYQPPPVRRIYILKADGKRWRPLGIPTIKDRIIQAIILEALEPQWEAKFEPSSYGFRPGRGRSDAYKRCFIHLSASLKSQPNIGKEWVVVADIKGCFDNVSHPALLNLLKDFPVVSLIEKWLTAGILEEGVFVDTEIGFPQGSIASPLLCNIALTGLVEATQQIPGPKPVVIRYADDFVILTTTHSSALAALDKAKTFLETRGLTFKESKIPEIVHITQGFDFLGCCIKRVAQYGYHPKTVIKTPVYDDNGKILVEPWFDERMINGQKTTIVTIEPSISNKKKFREKIKTIFHEYTGLPLVALIQKLNPVIVGFGLAFQTVNSTPTYRELDNYIFRLTIRYLSRKHPSKGWNWKKTRYFVTRKGYKVADNWVLRDPVSNICLLKLRYIPIITKYPLVVGEMCKDDPSNEAVAYWTKRQKALIDCKAISMFSSRDYKLAASQLNSCPICNSSLDNGESLHRHHIVERKLGGSDLPSNLILIHRDCHLRIHYSGVASAWKESLLNYKKSLSGTNKAKATPKAPPTQNQISEMNFGLVDEEDS